MDSENNEPEVEIDHLVMDLPSEDDPLAGQVMAQQLIRRLAGLLQEQE